MPDSGPYFDDEETVANDESGRKSGRNAENTPPAFSREHSAAPDPIVGEAPGDQIGPYLLVEQIGEGGFGVVYLARQTEGVKRDVALKILKPGMDTREVITRFEAERQALALMDHPGIANVHDAGSTAGGRPYFVMEYVKGIPVTEYCDRQQLGARERLQIVQKICRAVQHAHQKGIIHRDLKPSNILIPQKGKGNTSLNEGPGVKIIDFGIAKSLGGSLTDKTLVTIEEQLIGTPQYMSPEQTGVAGADVDTRSDIYSLGVVLYELLTGKPPFEMKDLRKAGFEEILRTIREEEPPPPSKRISRLSVEEITTIAEAHASAPERLQRQVQGELDWIVMKAIAKDRDRRYSSIGDLDEDIGRHLSGDAVKASPPSRVYQFRKFTSRHKGMISAAALVILSLVAGMTTTLRQAKRATAATEVANQRADLIERRLYYSDMQQAGRAVFTPGGGGLNTMEAKLSKWNPEGEHADVIGWEWYFLRALTRQSSEVILEGKEGESIYAKFSPDGKSLATLSADKISIRNFDDRAIKLTSVTEDWFGGIIDWLPDSKNLSFAHAYRFVRHWNTETGEKTEHYKDFEELETTSLAWSPGGDRFAVASSEKINVWHHESQKLEAEIEATSYHGGQTALDWSPDGKKLAWGDGRSLVIADAGDWDDRIVSTGHSKAITTVRWNSTGKVVATGSEDHTVRIFYLEDETDEVMRGHQDTVTVVDWLADRRFLVSGSDDGTIKVWDAPVLDVVTLYGHTSSVASLDFHVDSWTLVSGGTGGDVRFWKFSDCGIRCFDSTDPFSLGNGAIAWSPSGRYLVQCAGFAVQIWDPFSNDQVRLLGSEYSDLSEMDRSRSYGREGFNSVWWFDVAGKSVVAAQNKFGRREMWGNFTEKGIKEDDIEKLFMDHGEADQPYIFISESGKLAAIADSTPSSSEPSRKVYKVVIGESSFTKPYGNVALIGTEFSSIGAIEWSFDDQWISIEEKTGNVKFFEVASGKEMTLFESDLQSVSSDIAELPPSVTPAINPDTAKDPFTGKSVEAIGIVPQIATDSYRGFLWSPTDTRVAASNGQQIRIFDFGPTKTVVDIPLVAGLTISYSWSAEGKRIVTSAPGGSLSIWDSSNGEEVFSWKAHSDEVTSVAWSPDGNTIASQGSEGEIRIWSAKPGFLSDFERTEHYSVPLDLSEIIIPKVEFDDLPLKDALTFLKEQSRLLDTSPEIEEKGIDIKISNSAKASTLTPITLRLNNVSLKDALRYTTSLAQLKFSVVPDGVIIKSLSEPDDGWNSLADSARNLPIKSATPEDRLSRMIIPGAVIKEMPLRLALAHLQEFSRAIDDENPEADRGVTILLSEEAMAQADLPVSLQLPESSLGEALRQIIECAELTYSSTKDSIIISSREEKSPRGRYPALDLSADPPVVPDFQVFLGSQFGFEGGSADPFGDGSQGAGEGKGGLSAPDPFGPQPKKPSE